MTTVYPTNNSQKLHPYKFILWVAIGSIIMMFAGLTSAYIVKKNQSNWLEFDLPVLFVYSTAVILLSSLTIYLTAQAYKAGSMAKYKLLIAITALLGVAFIILQIMGFADLESRNIALTGPKSNSAASFLLVITGLHILHVLGGVIALVVIAFRASRLTGIQKFQPSGILSIEMAATYWHFVDILWIYLFIFYNWIG